MKRGNIKMNRLIILGNGFDLYHKLPTSYKKDFVPILKEKNAELFKKLSKLYFKDNEELWSDFENRIGSAEDIESLNTPIDDKLLEIFNIDIYRYSSESELYGSDGIELENAAYYASVENRLDLETAFNEFHPDLDDVKDYLQGGLKKMCEKANRLNKKNNYPKQNLHFSENDYFLTFNYTNTLELRYNNITKSNICHIHGSIDNNLELIFGNIKNNIVKSSSNLYGENPNFSRKRENEYESYDEQTFIEAVTFEEKEFDEYNAGVEKYMDQLNDSLVKDIKLNELQKFLSKFDTKQIFIFGLSMGEVDHPYFELIHKTFPDATWYVSYYSSRDTLEENIEELTFKDKIKLFEIKKFINLLR